MARPLEVWLLGARIGTLSPNDGRLSFFYAPGATTALSQSLPIRSEPFDDRACRPFFAGLLPEGGKRKQIAKTLQVSAQNDYALLESLGGECAGAVTLLEPGELPPAPDAPTEVRWLNPAQLLQILDEMPLRPMRAGEDGLRLSLAGAQDKLPVVPDIEGLNTGLPLNGSPSMHILKPPQRPQTLKLLDYVVFNALIGNHDAHGKNFSLLYAPSGVALTPLYDALCTAVYPQLTEKMAMKIGSKYKFSEVMARHWEQLAAEAALSPAQVKKRVLEIAKRLPDLAHTTQAGFQNQGYADPIIGRIVALINQRCALTISRFSAPLGAGGYTELALMQTLMI